MDVLEDTFFQQLAYICPEIRQAFARHIGMSQPRLQLLTLVGRTGDMSHAVLQQELALDGATVTRLVKQFEADGVLTRRLDPRDNRYTLISLTAEGQQMVADLKIAHSQFQTQLLAGISKDEQAITVRVLDSLRANMRTLQNSPQE